MNCIWNEYWSFYRCEESIQKLYGDYLFSLIFSEMFSNPWDVDSITDFNFYCCPECVYRYFFLRAYDFSFIYPNNFTLDLGLLHLDFVDSTVFNLLVCHTLMFFLQKKSNAMKLAFNPGCFSILFFWKWYALIKNDLCRSREESTFQTHALQNHPQSQTLFHEICRNSHQNVKEEILKIEPNFGAIKEDSEINNDDIIEKESLKQESELYDDLIPMIEEDNFEDEKKIEKHHDSSDVTTEFKAARSIFYLKFF